MHYGVFGLGVLAFLLTLIRRIVCSGFRSSGKEGVTQGGLLTMLMYAVAFL